MKTALKALGVVAGLLVLLLIVGALLDEGGTTEERIERECKRSYGAQGEAAVVDCRLAMTVRYLRDAAEKRSTDTYSRIR